MAILGAGPVGLEAALGAAEHGLDFLVLEAGERVAANVWSWGHVRMFSPWRLDVSARMRAALQAHGAAVPDDDDCPTGRELWERLLRPLAELPEVAPRLRLSRRVVAVSRAGLHKAVEIGSERRARAPFRLLVECAATESGRAPASEVVQARVVLDCTGSYSRPLWLGDGGIPAPGERELGAEIDRRLPDFAGDAEAWRSRRVLLVGAGHSAQTAAVELARLFEDDRRRGEAPGHLIWALRRQQPQIAVSAEDPLPERGRLHAAVATLLEGGHPDVTVRCGVTVEALARSPVGLRVFLRHADGATSAIEVERVLSLVGTAGDREIFAELQVHECYATGGPMRLAAALLAEQSADCLAQGGAGPELLTTTEPGFFVLGAKSYGRNSAFLMRTGYEQVESVLSSIAPQLVGGARRG